MSRKSKSAPRVRTSTRKSSTRAARARSQPRSTKGKFRKS